MPPIDVNRMLWFPIKLMPKIDLFGTTTLRMRIIMPGGVPMGVIATNIQILVEFLLLYYMILFTYFIELIPLLYLSLFSDTQSFHMRLFQFYRLGYQMSINIAWDVVIAALITD